MSPEMQRAHAQIEQNRVANRRRRREDLFRALGTLAVLELALAFAFEAWR